MESPSTTSVSLLARIQKDAGDENAWSEFVERYGGRIYEWCRARRLQESDAEDVTQTVLTKLAQHLGAFQYDPNSSFRGWLRRVTENSIADFYRGLARTPTVESSEPGSGLDSSEARLDLEQRLAAAFDLELFEMAKSRVRAQTAKNRWQAWELTAEQQVSSEEVSRRLDMKLATVYANRSKVQSMLAKEIQILENGTVTEAFS